MTNDEIKALVLELLANPNNKNKSKYRQFSTDFPALFKMATSGSMNMDLLEFMLAKRTEVNANDVTQEKASEQVGQELFDSYVTPLQEKMKTI